MRSNYIKQLGQIVKIIIDDQIDYLKLKNALAELKILFETVSGYDPELEANDDPINLESGEAIGPKWAGMCIEDIMRTKRYITGVYKAVLEVKKQNRSHPVNILYSGTGPFATLVMPLITLFKPNEVQFTLLEINPLTISYLQRTIKGFHAEEYVSVIHECDASEFNIPSAKEIDIVVIECLQHALAKEPQVSITYNLISQLNKEVILIPEEIALHIALIDPSIKELNLDDNIIEKQSNHYINSKPVVLLNKDEVLKNPGMIFKEEEVLFNSEDLGEKRTVAITTEITVFGNEKLSIDESGLTVPKILAYLDNDPIKGVRSKYMISDHPELEVTFIRD